MAGIGHGDRAARLFVCTARDRRADTRGLDGFIERDGDQFLFDGDPASTRGRPKAK